MSERQNLLDVNYEQESTESRYSSIRIDGNGEGGTTETNTRKWYLQGLWPRPVLLRIGDVGDEYEHDRETTVSELFFDLVYVVAIARLCAHLRELRLDVSTFLLYFFVLWQIWLDMIHYATRFGDNSLPNMLFFGLLMASVIGICNNMEDDEFSETVPTFATFAAMTNGLFIVVYLRIYWMPPTKECVAFSRLMLYRLFLFWICWIVLALDVLSNQAQGVLMWVFVIGSTFCYSNFFVLCLPCLNPGIHGEVWYDRDLFHGRLRIFEERSYVPLHLEHFTERLGLLVIIFLGESISALIPENRDQTVEFYARIFMSLGIIWSLRMLYFETDAPDLDHHALRRHRLTGVAFTYSHLWICAGILLFSCGLEIMISNQPNTQEHVADKIGFFCYGLAMSLGGMLVASNMHRAEWSTEGLQPGAQHGKARYYQKLRQIYYLQTISTTVVVIFIAMIPTFLHGIGTLAILATTFSLLLATVFLHLVDEMMEIKYRKQINA